MQRFVLVAALPALLACSARYPVPFTAAAMVQAASGDALVHYLEQPGAATSVCDRNARGPHFTPRDRGDLDDFVQGVRSVSSDRWQRCAMLMLKSAPAPDAAALLEAVVHQYHRHLANPSIERDAAAQARARALHGVLVHKPAQSAPRADRVARELHELRDAMAQRRLGPVAHALGAELLVVVDLQRGVYRGQPLTAATLDTLAERRDETTLRTIIEHVPDAALRTEAKRRVIRLHLARAPELDAAVVEERVLATGRNAVDVERSPPSAAWLDLERVRAKGVLVRQNPRAETVELLAFTRMPPQASLLPAVDLRNALFVRMPGSPVPLTVCDTPDALDVSPCILPAAIKPDVPLIYVDDDGLLHFVEHITSRDATQLVYNAQNLPLSLRVGSKVAAGWELPIVFERPDAIVFQAAGGERGPDLQVRVERRYAERLLFEVRGPQGKQTLVVEPGDLASFEIVSRGGIGASGTPGSHGAAGMQGAAGASATCGSPGQSGGAGGRGGDGGPGGNGGPGGAGGDVSVQVRCVTGNCESVLERMRALVRSEGGRGGSGGPGGRGGAGGAGGSGGSGTSCTDSTGRSRYQASGSTGPSGSQGSTGRTGANGIPGQAGRRTFELQD